MGFLAAKLHLKRLGEKFIKTTMDLIFVCPSSVVSFGFLFPEFSGSFRVFFAKKMFLWMFVPQIQWKFIVVFVENP